MFIQLSEPSLLYTEKNVPGAFKNSKQPLYHKLY